MTKENFITKHRTEYPYLTRDIINNLINLLNYKQYNSLYSGYDNDIVLYYDSKNTLLSYNEETKVWNISQLLFKPFAKEFYETTRESTLELFKINDTKLTKCFIELCTKILRTYYRLPVSELIMWS